ncbi:hypothetical protein [Nocardia sp. NPDC003963]
MDAWLSRLLPDKGGDELAAVTSCSAKGVYAGEICTLRRWLRDRERSDRNRSDEQWGRQPFDEGVSAVELGIRTPWNGYVIGECPGRRSRVRRYRTR